jgi:hypothetical protein
MQNQQPKVGLPSEKCTPLSHELRENEKLK